jgi:hypothetical protein
MESTGKAAIGAKQKSNIEYANVCQSLHIGFNNYAALNSHEFQNVEESYNDVARYSEFFKNELRYEKVVSITDQSKMNQTNIR